MPKPELNSSQMMTIGAKVVASLLVPRGWIKKRSIRMPAVVPTTVALEMLGTTTLRPCTAPRTDWAGVKIPSDVTIDTARTPMVFNSPLANLLSSMPLRNFLPVPPRSPVLCLFICIREASRGSRFVILSWIFISGIEETGEVHLRSDSAGSKC